MSADWITIAEAAERLQMNPKTVRRMIARGEIEASRFGPRVIRVRAGGIEAAGRPLQPELADHVAAVVAKFPPLTDERADRIAAILRGGAIS